jgi:NAD+ synthase (glutamine-hydrolysing)
VLASGKQFEEELITCNIELSGPRRSSGMASPAIPGECRDSIDVVVISDKPASQKRFLPPAGIVKPYALPEEVYHALVLGTRDYVQKNGFKNVVIGLSGGVDSSLVAAVAVAAIDREHVHGVFMPSQYSSNESREDADELARNLGIKMLTVPIHQPFNAFLETFRDVFADKTDITETSHENKGTSSALPNRLMPC